MLLDLESDQPEKRRSAVEHILKHRDASHSDIRAVAEKYIAQGRKGGTVRDALLLLGRLRAVDQIPYLVSRLNYVTPTLDVTAPPSIHALYPAAGALIYIGLQSIKPVITRLRAEADENALIAGAGVLRFVLGKKGAIGRIADELKTASPAERQSLEKVQQLLADYFMLQ